jgi:hypothetical protein
MITAQQAVAASAIAGGDVSVSVTARGAKDTLGQERSPLAFEQAYGRPYPAA